MNNDDPPVFMLAVIHAGHLFVAPLGTPFTLGPAWVDAGPAPDVLTHLTSPPAPYPSDPLDQNRWAWDYIHSTYGPDGTGALWGSDLFGSP